MSRPYSRLRGRPNDVYPIAHHEVGHAWFANAGQVLFAWARQPGAPDDERVVACVKRAPKIDRSEHFAGTVDSASRMGAFGNEYHGPMPLGRWLITKADLLVAQAVAHCLRPK